jgi:two-component system, chemotaxis family, CheB/CheR fusion protein
MSKHVETGNKSPPSVSTEDVFPIVGIGASAGGLAALKTLFGHVAEDSGLAFVVVMHLSPEHESHLEELLQPHVRMPVTQVKETIEIKQNCVYVIPPNANLDAIDTHLRLSKLEARRQERAPIDHFFRTLADSHGRNAIGVILSGTGSDGTLGLRRIKEQGGLTIVQAPAEAEYDGMPQSAIAAAPVDLVLPLADMPSTILRFVRTEPRLDLRDGDDADAGTRRFLQQVFAQVRVRSGREFSQYKRSTMMRRISRRMQFNQIQDPFTYVEFLRQHPEEVKALADDLLINVTNFFRDPEVFEVLAQQVIPKLFEGKGPGDTVRTWAVGCATGEEAYTLSVLLLAEAAKREAPPQIQVFASDLHQPSLITAREGFYPGDIGTDVPEPYLKRYFEREGNGYRVCKEVRGLVVFAPHNLLSDPPFSKLDLISCRNLLIYLNRELHQQVAELFHYSLRENGYLVLGNSENVEGAELFHVEDKKRAIYRKRNVRPPETRLPVFPLIRHRLPEGRPHLEPPHESSAYGAMHQRLIDQHGPPSVLVSPDDNVVHFSSRAGRYLVHPGGPPTSSVFKLVRQELRIELRAAVSAAREQRKTVRTKPTAVRFDVETFPVVLDVRPALEQEQEGFLLLLFDERPEFATPSVVPSHDDHQPTSADGAALLDKLESERQLAEQRLQQLIDEYETSQEVIKASNEELQSANEELRSTLEELETSKEELQSMNEELQTVNQENRHKVEELDQLSSDLQNLLVATDIATLFLDRELRIMRFTPKIEELFNVRLTDRGRALSDFTTRLGYDDLTKDAHKVLDRLIPIEHEVQDDAGRWYLTRVLPYRSHQDRIAGVVVTFVEITRLKQAEEAVRRAKENSERIIESLPEPLLVLTSELRVHSANAAFYEHFRANPEKTEGFRVYELGNRQWDIPDLRACLEEVLKNNATFRDFQVEHDFNEIGRRTMLLNARRLDDMHLILLGIHDITKRKVAEEQLRESDRRKDEYLAMLGHELRNPLGAIRSAADLIHGAETTEPNMRRAHAVLKRQSAHMSRIIDGLLDVSRIARGKINLELAPLDVRDVLDKVLEVRAEHTAKRDLTLKTDLIQGPLWVTGDEARLTQVFDNLLGNAIKFTPAPGMVTVTLRRDDHSAVIGVRDTGVGIRAELLPSIFESFQQERQDVARSEGGLGLGLALVKGLVELHQGTIQAHSGGPGTGSEFLVRLPLGSPPADRATDEPQEEPSRSDILIVEDNEDAAEMLRELLTISGHEVTSVANGDEALALLGRRRASVVLCDIGLPGMSGYDLARAIRRKPELRDIPLIALTGYGQAEDRRQATEAGFDEHLAKPVDFQNLARVIDRFSHGRA